MRSASSMDSASTTSTRPGSVTFKPSGSHKVLFKVILLGDSGVGKTSILDRFCKNAFSETSKPTIGSDFMTKDVTVDGKKVSLQMWDTAGQERFQSLSVAFFRGSDACVLVFDVNELQSFEHLEKWRNDFLDQSGCDPDTFPFFVIGNKVDVEHARQVPHRKASVWCEENGNIPYVECSAKENVNIATLFQDVARKALELNSDNKLELYFESLKVVPDFNSLAPPLPPENRCCGGYSLT